MSNIVHIIYRKPALRSLEMPIGLEQLAQELVTSGLMRIDAEPAINFVRFQDLALSLSITFSYRELFDKQLLATTRAKLSKLLAGHYQGQVLAKKVQQTHRSMQRQFKHLVSIPNDIELKLARALVQAAEPVIIQLLIHERTELFVTFGHDVGEVMDVTSWRAHGQSSGLQSTDGQDSNVYISCGGNPFQTPPKERQSDTHGDGAPALARLMVIGAQELGHYADLIRNHTGRKTARHSTALPINQDNKTAIEARKLDYALAQNFNKLLSHKDYKQLLMLEKQRQFYHDKSIKKRRLYLLSAKIAYRWSRYRRYLKQHNWVLPSHYYHNAMPATYLGMMIHDMIENLAPTHAAYQRNTAEETEIIACVEALARVPQQVVKWGKEPTLLMMPQLYTIYYERVVPSCIATYEHRVKQPYNAIESGRFYKLRTILAKILYQER